MIIRSGHASDCPRPAGPSGKCFTWVKPVRSSQGPLDVGRNLSRSSTLCTNSPEGYHVRGLLVCYITLYPGDVSQLTSDHRTRWRDFGADRPRSSYLTNLVTPLQRP